MMSSEDPPMKVEVNGETYTVPDNLEATLPLCDFLRDNIHKTGTKFTCREGSCGSCIVSAKVFDPATGKDKVISINSCLRPIYACQNMKISTVEGIGDKKKGYHPVQQRLAEYNGTQCGFCSSGMVMQMYSLLQNNPAPHTQDIEDVLDGNVCRCTGYRPILDAWKSFAGPDSFSKLQKTSCTLPCQMNMTQCCKQIITLPSGEKWFHPVDLPKLYEILNMASEGATIRLVVGNTSMGIFKHDGPYDIYVDMQGVYELYKYDITNEVSFGASVPLADMISNLKKLNSHPYYKTAADHLKKIANVAVRNVGSWSGNLMTKHNHPLFPSDVYVVFECLGVKLTVSDAKGKTQDVSTKQLMGLDMKGKVILKAVFPKLTSMHKYNSYKIMPRMQNSHACTNGAFLMKLDESANFKVLDKPSIVLGGFNNLFDHATKTEEFLKGKELGDIKVFQDAVKILSEEIKVDPSPELTGVDYRKNLALNLFYKYVLGVLPNDKVSQKIKTGATAIERPISSGKQTFDTDKSQWPINQPVKKLEAQAQCSGEAEYIPDIPRPPGTVYGAFVISDVGNAEIKSINADEALKTPGVLGFLTHKDIPGENNILPVAYALFFPDSEELFSSGKIAYAGQAIGLIVADTLRIAERAARMVKIDYKVLGPPVLTIEEGIEKGSIVLMKDFVLKEGDADAALKKAKHVIKGETTVGSQYHFHMETQVCLTIPTEEGFDVSASTQWLELSQQAICQVLNINKSKVHLQIRRLGGAFGAKITRNLPIAAACTLASSHFNKPVFIQMDLESNLEMCGRRHPYLAKYEVGFDDKGKLEAVKIQHYMDHGYLKNETALTLVMNFTKNCYVCDNWYVTPTMVMTNLPPNTSCRTPGTVKGIFTIETIMEHIARTLKLDAQKVKLLNMQDKPEPSTCTSMKDLFKSVQKEAEVDKRLAEIEEFNKANRWKKRGLAAVPMRYPEEYHGFNYNALVSIYSDDGSVVVVHAGVEMGQGVNTKVLQVCAHELGIPMELITIRPTDNVINPNGSCTAGAIASELCCFAVLHCCKQLQDRIKPVRDKMKSPYTWAELITECNKNQVDLCARYRAGPPNLPEGYTIFGVTFAEAEVDALTGELQIRRVDLHFDCGQSISPQVDIGQIEGSFIMGMGLMLFEKVKLDPKTGRNVTAGFWEYNLPSTKDIPVDFRVTILKNSKNPFGVLKSKTAGEPPLCMSSSVLFAVQNAIQAVRAETGDTNWVPLGAPATYEAVQLACGVKPEQFVYKK